MHVLILGVCGVLGSRLAASAIDEGFNVTGFKRSTSNTHRIDALKEDIRLFDTDSSDDMLKASSWQYDCVVNTITSYGRSGESRDQVRFANCNLPTRLLVMANRIGASRFINCDTNLVRSLNFYSKTKGEFATFGKEFGNKNEIDFVNLRIGTFYGAVANDEQFSTFIIKKCLANSEKVILTGGSKTRDFIYIDDVVSAIMHVCMLRELPCGQDIYVGTGELTSIGEFAALVRNVTCSTSRFSFGSPGENQATFETISASGIGLQKYGWSCLYPLDQGIRCAVAEFKRQHV